MSKKNKSNYSICLIKRKKKVKKLFKAFDFVIAKKSKHNKLFVIEKLGSLDFVNHKININIFRLIFWLQFNPAVNPKAWYFLTNYVIKKW